MKPLERALFHTFWNQIMNHVPNNNEPAPLLTQHYSSVLG